MSSRIKRDRTPSRVRLVDWGKRPVFWNITFLSTILFWMLLIHPDCVVQFILTFLLATTLSVFTYPIFGIALTLVIVPVSFLRAAACGKADSEND